MNLTSLQEYSSLLDQIYDTLVQENTLLSKRDEDGLRAFFPQKELQNERLADVNSALKAMNEAGSKLGIQGQDLAKAIEKKLMKAMLLIKENQKLFLEGGYQNLQELSSSAVSSKKMAKAYGK